MQQRSKKKIRSRNSKLGKQMPFQEALKQRLKEMKRVWIHGYPCSIKSISHSMRRKN